MTPTTDRTRPSDGAPLHDAGDQDYLRHPATAAARYLADGLWGTSTIDELLLAPGLRAGADAPAVTADGRTVSHAELGTLVDAAAGALADAGVERGTRLVLHLPNGLDVIVLTIALLRMGAVPAFALPAHRASEIVHVARTARASVHLLGELPGLDARSGERLRTETAAGAPGIVTLDWPTGLCLRLAEQRRAPSPPAATVAPGTGDASALAFFQLSGGTTGPSKLIPRAHREYAYSFLRSTEVCGFDSSTVLLPAIPLTHNFPMSSPGWMGVLAVGGHVVVPSAPDAVTVGAAITEHGVTHVQAVPPLVHSWLDAESFPRRALTRILVGGARLAPSIARRVHRELAPLQQVYGMAEGLVCYTPLEAEEELIVRTQGRPMSPADRVRVVDADGAEVPPGTPGELQVAGPYTIPAYYRAGAAGEASFCADGHYRTGDIVTRTAEGDLTVVGRVKEQINRGGEKVAPAEVESALLRHPGVADVCVRGIEDEVLGERVEAYVVAKPDADGVDTRTLRRHLRDASLADFKIPARFHLVDRLPQTAVGKIDRRATGGDGDAASTVDATAGSTTAASGRSADGADTEVDVEEVDVLGIGFGPANMAVAAALRDVPRDRAPRALFLDAADGPGWHTGMLLPGASLQVSFAKDLVTFRNPRSELSFLNFLVEQGRIHDFFNRGSTAPLRAEFAAYLRWAAERLGDSVRYGHRVESVEPVVEGGTIVGYLVRAATAGGPRLFRARDVVAAAGLRAHTPAEFGSHPRLLHSSRYLHEIDDIPVDARREGGPQLVVIGGGQSAAEVALDLRTRHPSATVHLVHSRFGLIPSDATPYANRIFDHDAVDRLFDAPAPVRERLDAEHRNTNYSVVHENTLQELYDTEYADSWAGRRRLVIHDASRIARVGARTDDADGTGLLTVDIEHELDGGGTSVAADVVVAATGYRAFDPSELLGASAASLVRDAAGRPVAERDYALRWRCPAEGRLFSLGSSGHQHGISTTLLSGVALRAGEVVDTLLVAPDAASAHGRADGHGSAARERVEAR
ncbi:SidA/IucD/PvdA family monooxygenase [Mycetocola reblochoni]|uniref:L-lysine N6-monooxygenase MbtG n=2 Tax=Mycetocola reblochoni TaxID=331618 RepID=A0A1R4ICG4_9MICO|nr:SidA/IucD/PvdA family monooxygenase [Mycetocola reblochoni]RLP69137.1 hypothetical protein D9V30_07415 [Mycetocola reblochoni]SJN17429.1 2,3-dihydroxybenzoate-AMP ligase of siderophore biosynthesis [Mycetocola reblochoni REB411]